MVPLSESAVLYLDNAATSYPKPDCVIEGTLKCLAEFGGNPGRGSHYLARAAAEVLYGARSAASRLFGAPGPENVAFLPSATYALNTVIKGVTEPGDHVVISDMEHNSVLRPVSKLRKEGRITYSVFKTSRNPDMTIRSLEDNIKDNTSLVICQHCSNICGRILPIDRIGALCRSRNIIFAVDAAQSAGMLDIDILKMGIDFLCVPSHKGLLAPQGAGMIAFSNGDAGNIKTLVEGGSGSNSLSSEMPSELPDKFEAGTMPTPVIAGLLEGIVFLEKVGIDKIREHETELGRYLTSELLCDRRIKVFSPAEAGGTVLFNANGMTPSTLAAELDKRGICTRPGFHCAPLAHGTLDTGESGALRVSFGVFNTKRDAVTLLDALQRIIK